MGYDYTISKANATQDAWANPATLTDPVQYTTEQTARVTAKYYGKPVLEELLALIGSRVSSRAYQKTWTCIAGLNVGDPVYVSATDTVTLALATTAATSRVIGFVRYKPTTTSCYIEHYQLKTGLSGLTAGNPVYLSDAGGFAAAAGTITKVLGIATDTDEAVVSAEQGGAELAALSGTTANTFTIDSDSVTGKIIIDVALGAADKSLTLTNAALTDNRIITFPDLTGTVGLLIDEDNMASNLDTKCPTQQSVKAYCDTFLPLAGGQISGNVTCAGAQTFDGRDLSADGSKLDGIESGADVTDAANVLAALAEPAADVVFNEDGHDHDFRVESDTLTHALFVQGSDGFVGIGQTPSAPLHVFQGTNCAPSLTFNAAAGCILNGSTTEQLAFGCSNSSPYPLWLQGRNSSNAAWDLVINPLGGNVGLGESSPGTLFDMASTAPYLTTHCTTHTDSDGARISKWIAEGEQSGGELTTLGEIEFSHDGASDDEKGKFVLRLNDGNDGTSPTTRLTVISDGTATLTGNFYPGTDDTYYLGKNDDDSPLAWKGVILKDTTNGKYYRVEVISGVVTATDLTD